MKIKIKPKKKKSQFEINHKYFIECGLFTMFFTILTIFTFNIIALFFAFLCGIATFIFWQRNNENKD